MSVRTLVTGTMLAAFSTGGCAGSGSTVHPDETTVEGHRREAARERAATHASQVGAIGFGGDSANGRVDPTSTQIPTVAPPPVPQQPVERRYEREWHEQHARDHERAATALERFESDECRSVDAKERNTCPLLGPVAAIEDLPRGVRIRLSEPAAVETTVTRMRCHYAFARAHGFSQATSCPLYIKGIDIERSREPGALEIVGATTQVAREIQKRARQQAVFRQPTAP